MENFLNKLKNNDYLKQYIRILKEKKLYKTKINITQFEEDYLYISKERFKSYYSHRPEKPYKLNSLISNIELPNILISTATDFNDFIDMYNEYNRNIAPHITKALINKIIKQYDIKLTKKEQQTINDKIIKKLRTTIFNDTPDKSNYLSGDELITKMNKIINQQLKNKLSHKLEFINFKKLLYNTTNSKWK